MALNNARPAPASGWVGSQVGDGDAEVLGMQDAAREAAGVDQVDLEAADGELLASLVLERLAWRPALRLRVAQLLASPRFGRFARRALLKVPFLGELLAGYGVVREVVVLLREWWDTAKAKSAAAGQTVDGRVVKAGVGAAPTDPAQPPAQGKA